MIKVLTILGTRPEAIKLCPVIRRLAGQPSLFTVRTCATAQHRDLLAPALHLFGVQPDYDLNIMKPGQSLSSLTARLMERLDPVLAAEMPDIALVQGDTTTALCGALAAFYRKVQVGHVEAGLRTRDFGQPFPEEMNRVLAARLATLHFAATPQAAQNLRLEGVPDKSIHVTGNPVIDAVTYTAGQLQAGIAHAGPWPFLDERRKLILVTAHRRENFGGGVRRICQALRLLAGLPDVQIVFPVHPNPNVAAPVSRLLSNVANIHLIPPQDYVPFVDLMRRSSLLLTDSGGVQEEAPSLGKPVLVFREKTERPEAVEAGASTLVGTDPNRIAAEVTRLLDEDAPHEITNPYGDGHASHRIAAAIQAHFNPRDSRTGLRGQLHQKEGTPFPPFTNSPGEARSEALLTPDS